MAMLPQSGGGDAVVNVNQARNQVLTQMLAALKALAPTSLIGSGPQATQTITANGQTISVGQNGSVVLTTTTGANMTGMILGAAALPGQQFTVMNTSAFTIAFTASVAGSPTQAANSAQSYMWDGTNLVWRQIV